MYPSHHGRGNGPAPNKLGNDMTDIRELSVNELDAVSGGESIGHGLYAGFAGGFCFEYDSRTGNLTVSTEGSYKNSINCNSNGRCSSGPA